MAKRMKLDSMHPLGDATQFCNRNELDFFTSPKEEDPVTGFQDIIRRPISSIENDGPLTFQITANDSLFTDLTQTYLTLKVKVTKEDGSAISSTTLKNERGERTGDRPDVSIPNDFFDCLFAKISLFLNGVKVGSEHNYHPQVAVLRILVSYSGEVASSVLENTVLWQPDSGEESRSLYAFFRYKQFIKNSKECTMIGRLSHDMFNSVRLLPPKTDLTIRFDRATPEFSLIKPGDEGGRFKVKFLDANLMVRRVKLSEKAMKDVEKHWASGAPIYLPFSRTDARAFEIPRGTTKWRVNGLFSGTLPERALFVLTEPESVGSGSYTNNPVLFPASKYKLSSLQFYVNEKAVLPVPYEPEWDAKQYQGSFHGLLSTIGLAKSSVHRCSISYVNFGADYGVFGVVFKAMKEEEIVGVISLELGFKSATTQSVAGLFIPEYKSCVIIDSEKQVSQVDF